jgi:hypothetical protein
MKKLSLTTAIALLCIGTVGFTLFFLNVKYSSNAYKTPVSHIAQSEFVKAYPAAIPWISNQQGCEDSNREWQEGKCMDYEHSPSF